MSTSETVEFPVGVCPCGQGRIVRSVTTQDNPWSGADIFHYIDCRECAGIWRMEHSSFVKISTEADYNQAREQEKVCRERLHDLVNSLVNTYFATFAAKTKKAEHEEMVRLGITNSNYRAFLKRKNEGDSPAQLTHASNNPDWLAHLARASSMDEELNRRRAACSHAEAVTRGAYKKIVRRRIPKHPPPVIEIKI